VHEAAPADAAGEGQRGFALAAPYFEHAGAPGYVPRVNQLQPMLDLRS
jgi:hypothetical protein